MKIGQENRFIAFNKTASSLYSLIADGKYRSTSLGRDEWKALIGSQASLQTNCNREGFNVESDSGDDWPKARIGILANNDNGCFTCDSAQEVTLTTSVLVETALTVNSQQKVQTLKRLDTFLCNEPKTN